ncbi:MAG: WYL domain-containing protein [Gemmatimonadota bacterium]
MTDGRTAEARLERLLHVLPAAARSGGASLSDLARELGASEARILEDLEEVTARVFYHPGGWPDDVSILVEADRVRVTRATGMERPVRLSPRETLCLALALRGTVAAAHLPSDDRRAALLRRAEEFLGQGTWSDEGAPGDMAAPERAPDPAGVRETLFTAARDRRPCAISYVKAGATDASVRVIHPYVSAYAGGFWYTIAWCAVEESVRIFRMDRVLEAAESDDTFTVPEDFDPAVYLDGGQVFHSENEVDVSVRYSPRIARWIRERAEHHGRPPQENADGSLERHHQVADPHWVVSHVLQYGPDAEILGPESVRAMVRDVVQALVG